MSRLTELSITETRDLLLKQDVTALEVLDAYLERVTVANPEINAVVTLAGTARDQARDLDARIAAGDDVGPLAGVPVGIKDVTPVRGLRHTYGSPLYAEHTADVDAVVVQRLRDAGAIVVGKTNTPEFATGGNTFNEVFGATRNPWNPELSAGGSTGGGAAALAAGMIAIAEGTDLGGSLRIPAAFCGVVGLRPTPGLVPTWPHAYAWDTMQVSGMMARSAEDLALGIQSVAGSTPMAPIGRGLGRADLVDQVRAHSPAGQRLGYCPDVAAIGIDAGIDGVCRDAVTALVNEGAQASEVALDLSFARDAFLALRGHWMVAQQAERLDQLDAMGTNLRGNIESGLAADPRALGRAEQVRGQVWDLFRRYFTQFDFLLTPTTAVPPFPVDQNYPETIAGKPMNNYLDWLAPTFLISLAGLPTASVPAGLDADGLPVGLQIVGRPHGEGDVLALAASVQACRPLAGAPGAA